jgi:hypothetical protein
VGQKQKSSMRAYVFRFTPESGRRATWSACPFRADIVAKVENRTTRRISRKSFLDAPAAARLSGAKTKVGGRFGMSLTSRRAKRISGSKNFRSTPQKDFCNKICHKQKFCALTDLTLEDH